MTQEMKDTFKEIGELFLKMANQLEKYEEKEVGEDGWIKWGGGENPVPNKRVLTRDRDGTITEAHNSDMWGWDHIERPDDIVSYKIVKDNK